MSSRNSVLDIARAIAIILVVIGHSGIEMYVRDSIYLFHMPLFFFISGILLKQVNKNLHAITSVVGGGNPEIQKTLFPICLEYIPIANS